MDGRVLADGTDALLSARAGNADLPSWAAWLIELGRALGAQAVDNERRRWVALSLPTRDFAAALVAAGAILSFDRAATPTLDPGRFDSLSRGDRLTWVDQGRSLSGDFVKVERGILHYEKRLSGRLDRRQRIVETAMTFHPADPWTTWAGWKPAACRPDFVEALCGKASEWFLSSSDIDVIVVGVRSVLEPDFYEEFISLGGYTGSLLDIVRPRELMPLGQHHRSALLSSRMQVAEVGGSSCHGPAIFDGAGAYLALRGEIDSPSGVVLLDRWHPRSEDGAIAAMIERSDCGPPSNELELGLPPPGIEFLTWEEWR